MAITTVAVLGGALVAIAVATVVVWSKQPDHRPIRQAWAEAPHSQRWDWSTRLLYCFSLFFVSIPLWPPLVRAIGAGALATVLIVGGAGYARARSREGNPVDVTGPWRRARTHVRAVFRRS
ncbi:hypothetical protein IQ251_13950 [Saccharopolyspora sp. HNM0983]|uniref:Uncharacterized protein n=1 Tax=Saccharopolyspora montiporae TaxID=2781240 RepID=A0A929BDL0_9PSEU|nr:hypothetical protein [Saccharopolyspora sp. HNM0983]MBE9375552.1 hypothetical protein [Saccharopolyspora sp. HNM0983]